MLRYDQVGNAVDLVLSAEATRLVRPLRDLRLAADVTARGAKAEPIRRSA